MRFEFPWVFAVLLLVPVLLYFRSRGKPSLKFSSTRHAGMVKPSLKQRLAKIPILLRVLSLVFLIIALARPQEGREQVRDISKGVAIEMVVDRSGSMDAEMEYGNERLNRLGVVKKVFKEFITGNDDDLPGRPNDLIGMVSFARYADTIAPLTLAHGALTQFLDNLKIVKRKEEDGTAIGEAIALAAARLKTAEEVIQKQTKQKSKSFEIKSKIIILLTDGQNNQGNRSPQEAASLAKKWGIKIYAIGVGGDEGLRRQQGIFGAFLMQAGAGVDKDTLKNLADTTNGLFRMASDADSLRAIYKEIDELERSEVESIRYMDYKEMFQPFLYIAMGLIVLEVILSNTVFRKIP